MNAYVWVLIILGYDAEQSPALMVQNPSFGGFVVYASEQDCRHALTTLTNPYAQMFSYCAHAPVNPDQPRRDSK